MRDRPLIQRNLCRRALRKQLSKSNDVRREMIRTALSDRAIFETLYEQAMARVAQDALSTGEFTVTMDQDGAPVVDNLLKLLRWFIDNGPELIRIIETIIGLFGGDVSDGLPLDPQEN